MSLVTQADISPYQGWERYPLNLENLFPEFNLELCNRLLRKETEKLFNPRITDIRIETIPILGYDKGDTMRRMTDCVTSEDELEGILAVRIKDFAYGFFGVNDTKETPGLSRRSLHVCGYSPYIDKPTNNESTICRQILAPGP